MERTRRFAWTTLILLSAMLLFGPAGSAFAEPELTVGNYQLVASKRVSRFEFEYTYKADITNTGSDALDVSATLDVSAPGVTVLDADLEFGDVKGGSSATSSDTFKIRQNRRLSIGTEALQWEIRATDDVLAIVELYPVSGTPGTTATIRILGLADSGADLTLWFDGEPLPYSFVGGSKSVVEFMIPDNASTAPIFVSENNRKSNVVIFDVPMSGIRLPKEGEIVIDEDGTSIAVNLLVVSFNEDSHNLTEAWRVANTIGAAVTVPFPLINGYQFIVPTTDLFSLYEVAREVEADPSVDFVVFEYLIPHFNTWSTSLDAQSRRALNRMKKGADLYQSAVDPVLSGKKRPVRITLGVLEQGVDFDSADFDEYYSAPEGDENIRSHANDIVIYSRDVGNTASADIHGTTAVGLIAAELGDDQLNASTGNCGDGCNAGLLQALGASHGGFDIHVRKFYLASAFRDLTTRWFSPSTVVIETGEMLEQGARVLNWSFGNNKKGTLTYFGSEVDENELDEMFASQRFFYEKFLQKIQSKYLDAVIVIASGNGGVVTEAETVIPSGIESEITVVVGAHTDGGVNSKDNAQHTCVVNDPASPFREWYSNFGVGVDMLAAGNATQSDGSTARGTSFAAPLVAGTIAAMKSISPTLSATEIREILRKSALPVDPNVVDPQDCSVIDVSTRILESTDGETRADGSCLADASLVCQGMAARLNVEGAILAVLEGDAAFNLPPEAVDDVLTVDQGEEAVLDVIDNDRDRDGDNLEITQIETDGLMSTVSQDGSKIAYRPNLGFSGVDVFEYTISDGAYSDTATVSVTVLRAPEPPTASLMADRTSIVSGQSATLSWSSTGADTCTGSSPDFDTGGDLNGAMFVSPNQTTTYVLTCTGPGDTVANDEVTITVSAEPPPQVEWTISPADISVDESVGTVTFTVTRSDSTTPKTVYVSTVQDQGATNDGDYEGKLNETLDFSIGDEEKPVTVIINDDDDVEDDETFRLIVQDELTDAVTPLLAEARFTIIDSDSPDLPSYPLNDTGIDWCADGTTNFLPCPVAGYPGQDAESGRDVTNDDDSDGHAGFSFTKLDANGDPLAIQDGSWDETGSEAAGTKWSCVRDNITGRIWEVKTGDGGFRDADWTYSWYNPDPTTNGGSAGYEDVGDNCFDPARCDTHKYVADVNAQSLCGASDWRLASVDELLSIVSNDRARPAVDTGYFPNSQSPWFWSSSPDAVYYSGGNAWYVNFNSGYVYGYSSRKSEQLYVRLVRGGQ